MVVGVAGEGEEILGRRERAYRTRGASAVECLCTTSASSAIAAVALRTAPALPIASAFAIPGCALSASLVGFVEAVQMRQALTFNF